jgi:cytochrome b involved in lipid metabolism
MNNYKSIYYKGLEYDISEFINTHPGGKNVIDNYIKCSREVTELFKSLHSKEAEKQLLALKTVGKV